VSLRQSGRSATQFELLDKALSSVGDFTDNKTPFSVNGRALVRAAVNAGVGSARLSENLAEVLSDQLVRSRHQVGMK